MAPKGFADPSVFFHWLAEATYPFAVAADIAAAAVALPTVVVLQPSCKAFLVLEVNCQSFGLATSSSVGCCHQCLALECALGLTALLHFEPHFDCVLAELTGCECL